MTKNVRNILYINGDRGIPVWGSSGGSIHIREFVQALKNAQYSPKIITARLKEGSSAPDIPVATIPEGTAERFFETEWGTSQEKQAFRENRSFYQNGPLEALLHKTCSGSGCDLIYERYSLFSFAARSFAAERRIPYVLEVNSPLIAEAQKHRSLALVDLARRIEKYLFSTADHIVAVSSQVKSYICSVSPNAKVSVLPNAVNPARFNGHQSKSGASDAPNKRDGEFLIGFLGSLRPWHGLEILLDAFAELSNSNSGCRLMIIGDGRRLRPELEKRCRSLRIDDSVSFTGMAEYEAAPKYLSQCDALVAPYPALDEFYFSPLKVFEYMAAGKAIVASDIGQISETLRHEETALLAAPGDKRALAAALKRLKSSPDLRRRLGEAARREALSMHTWDKRIEQVGEIFGRLASEAAS